MLTVLRHIAQEMNLAGDLRSALQIVVSSVQDALQVELCTIYLVDNQHQYLLLAFAGENTPPQTLPLTQGLHGLVAKREAPVAHLNLVTEEGQKELAFLGVPILHHHQLLGMITVEESKERVFSEEDEAFLVTLAAQLTGHIVHAKDMGVILQAHAISPEKFALQGVAAVSGVAIGQGKVIYPLADLDAIPDRQITQIEVELQRFTEALQLARQDIIELQQRLSTTLPKEEQVLFSAYLQILNSPDLVVDVATEIRNKQWAEGALRHVIKKHAMQFATMDDHYLKERAEDILALGQRILFYLQEKSHRALDYPQNTILIGERLTAADLVDVPEGQLLGVISYSGSSNSHVAILARALNIPTIMAASGVLPTELENKLLVMDGFRGCLYVDPSPTLLQKYMKWEQEEKDLDYELQNLRHLPNETPDGHTLDLYLNTGFAHDIALSSTVAAAGVGLFRTEMSFMNKTKLPTETEQRKLYRQLLEAFSPRPVTMRTLDIGGDKSLPYFPIQEENPFLGWRGIRFTLDHPDVFLMQLRAMLMASEGLKNLQIMFPMITSIEEVDEGLQLLQQAYQDVIGQGYKVTLPKVGVMLEVPAAIYQIQALAKRVDFFSVGSNDLAQYVLAVDRNNARVSNRFDNLHPAVLRILQEAVKKAHACDKPISLCGEIASDPVAAVLLLGLGFDHLSMNPGIFLRIKWIIRTVPYKQAKRIVNKILKMESAVDMRAEVISLLDKAGLGGLIRAGKR